MTTVRVLPGTRVFRLELEKGKGEALSRPMGPHALAHAACGVTLDQKKKKKEK